MRSVEAIIQRWNDCKTFGSVRPAQPITNLCDSFLLGCSLHQLEVVGDRRREASRATGRLQADKSTKDTLKAQESSSRDPKHVKK